MNLHTAGHRRGVVCAPHAAAAEAGRAILAEGGNAHRGDGRDGGVDRRRLSAHEPYRRRRLLARPRAERARARASWRRGRPARRATPALYREHGHDAIPPRGPLAALTVPGAVGGWMLALEAREARVGGKGCRSTCCCHAAIGHAREGYTVTRSQARLTTEKLPRWKGVPGFARDVPDRRQAARSWARSSSRPRSPRRSIISPKPGSTISIAAMSGARSPPISNGSAAR